MPSSSPARSIAQPSLQSPNAVAMRDDGSAATAASGDEGRRPATGSRRTRMSAATSSTPFAENAFKIVREAPVSTFSIDVDTASYSWVRASLNENVLPQPAAVRTEEMVNYFHYDYAPPRSAAQPFSTNVAVFPSPWAAGRKLVRIGIKGYAVREGEAAARRTSSSWSTRPDR